MKRVLWITIPLIALGMLIGWRLHYNALNVAALAAESKHQQTVVGYGYVVPKNMTLTFEATSNIEAPNTVVIAPKLQEQIDYLQVVEGDHVTVGEVLVRLNDADIMAQVRTAQANLAQAKARYLQAQVTQNPVNVSVGTTIREMEAGVATAQANEDDVVQSYNAQLANAKAAVTDSQGKVNVAQAGVAQAKAQVVAAKANLDDANLKLTRYETLLSQNFIDQQDVDDQRATVAVQQGSYEVAESQLVSAQASLDSANAELNSAQQEYAITKTKADTDIDSAKAQVKQAVAALVNAKANVAQVPAYVANLAALKAAIQAAAGTLANAQAMETQTVLTSPVDGYVTSRIQNQGSMAVIGSPILDIQTMSTVWINMPVPEEQIKYVQIGKPARITVDSIPDRVFIGDIVQLNPSADPTSRQFTVRIALRNPDNVLKPGMFARASFVTERLIDATAIPPEAVQIDADGNNFVWVINDDNTVTEVPITTGDTVDGFVHVESGLSLGQKLVTLFKGTLRDGMKVKLASPKVPGAAPAASTASYSSAGAGGADSTPQPASMSEPASAHHRHYKGAGSTADTASPGEIVQ